MEHHWDWYQVLALKRCPFNCQSNYQVSNLGGEGMSLCILVQYWFNIGDWHDDVF